MAVFESEVCSSLQTSPLSVPSSDLSGTPLGLLQLQQTLGFLIEGGRGWHTLSDRKRVKKYTFEKGSRKILKRAIAEKEGKTVFYKAVTFSWSRVSELEQW